MAESYQCPQCGAEVPGDAPQGLCPNCVLKAGLGTQQTGSFSRAGSESAFAGSFDAPPTPAELAPCFPDLEILEFIGRGGMGMVYKARQRHLDRPVALKILLPNIARDPAFAERFMREARAMAMLNHPHVVTVHDFGQTGGLYYFLMEFVDGLTLRQLLDAGKLAPQAALAIVPQICEALQYAHDKGVVHRDIKPENILMDRGGQVKIADFGLAKLVGQGAKDFLLTGAGQVMGTPHYMAPEQVEHPQEVDHRADIYSLGVVFYQMLTGELPIGRFAPPSKKVQIDVRLDEVVLRALEKEPELRYQQASEVKTRLETIAATPASRDGVNEQQPSTASRDGKRFLCGIPVLELRDGKPFISWRGMVIAWLATFGCMTSAIILPWLNAGKAIPLSEFLTLDLFTTTALTAIFVWAGVWTATRQLGTREGRAVAGVKTGAPRFSRTAIVGACWIPFFFAATAFVAFEPHGDFPYGFNLTATLLCFLALAGCFGTTILGAVAMAQIRHSAGRLYGLSLALFDTLLFPLLLLNGLMGWLWWWVFGELLYPHQIDALRMNGPAVTVSRLEDLVYSHCTALIVICTFLTAGPLCLYIIRWAWRAANKPLNGLQLASTPGPTEDAFAKTGLDKSDWVLVLFERAIYVIALLVALLPFFVLGIDPGDRNHWIRLIGCPLVALAIAAAGRLIGIGFRLLLVRLNGGVTLPAVPKPSMSAMKRIGIFLVLIAAAYLTGKAADTWLSNRNGEKTKLDVPAGSTVTITENGSAEVKVATGGASPEVSYRRVMLPKLQLAKSEAALQKLKARVADQEAALKAGTTGAVELQVLKDKTQALEAELKRFTAAWNKFEATVNRDKTVGLPPSEFAKAQNEVGTAEVRLRVVQAAAENDAGHASFGPVMERLVPANDEPPWLWFDVDSGEPISLLHDDNDRADFAAAMTVRRGLSTADETGFGSVPLDAARWDTLTPDQLTEKLKSATVDPLLGEEPLPRTYGFTTRAGGMGILQITGFSEKPRGIKIRYKLVQGTNPSAEAGAEKTVTTTAAEGPINVDVELETMQNMVFQLQGKYDLRVSLENLDFDPNGKDGTTIEQAIRLLEKAAKIHKLSEMEEKRLAMARKELAEGKSKDAGVDFGPWYSWRFQAHSTDELLDGITKDTPYTWRRYGPRTDPAYVILPKSGSLLQFPVTLDTKGMSLEQAVQKILDRQPRIMRMSIDLRPGPGEGCEYVGESNTSLPAFTLKNVPAMEALCQVTSCARPSFTWELAGFKGGRLLSVRVHGWPWGEAVNGLQARLKANLAKYRAGLVPAFRADVRNVGTLDSVVAQSQVLCELEFDDRWYHWAGPVGIKGSPLPPGRRYNDIPLTLGKEWQTRDGKPLDLPSGKHTLRVAFVPPPGLKGISVRFVSNPVEFEIVGPKPPAARNK